jgi:SAM-dependent methyltransferase
MDGDILARPMLTKVRSEVGAVFYDAIRPVEAWRHRGGAVHCPLCSATFDRWMLSPGNRTSQMCWSCHSYPRHRALWMFMDTHPELLANVRSLLHFAPERSLRRKLEQLSELRYETADIRRGRANLQLDITDMRSELGSSSFDAILCSHVLEHVDDDRAAMREMHRVLKPGGWAIVMVPIDFEREHTYEDASIVKPADRERAFWQNDHVRLYALDVANRLEDVGFSVDRLPWTAEIEPAAATRFGLSEADQIFLCVKAAG